MGGVALGVAAVAVVGGAVQMGMASSAKNKAEAVRLQKESAISQLENNRQAIINPYADVEDLSGMIENPYANLSVATQAAEMQVQEADISLANTLDTIRASGASAGGATALAQAALKSKMGVSASIEQQEAANEKLKAQGEADKQRAVMEEKQRIQQAEVAGKQFVYQQQENRDMQQLNRLQAQADLASGAEAAAAASQISAVGNMTSSITSAIGVTIWDG